MGQEFLKEEFSPMHPNFMKTIFFINKKKDCHHDPDSTCELRAEVVRVKPRIVNSWFQYAMYLHILLLYILLFSVYNELKRTKEIMYDFHMNMINISMKGIEVEKNCLSEISSFRSTLKLDNPLRYKRNVHDLPETENGFEKGNENIFYGSPEEDIPHLRTARKAPQNSRRGKTLKRKKNRRGRLRHGFPRATHLIGALPEPIVRDGGWLAPWMIDREAIKDFTLNTKVPERGREAVEIMDSGLYFIYSQVYYMSPNDSTKAHASFYIMLRRGASTTSPGKDVILAQCATLGDSKVGGEASCFTGTAQSLLKGDIVYIKQRERERHIIMRRGQTFLGLVLLNKRMNDKSVHLTDSPLSPSPL